MVWSEDVEGLDCGQETADWLSKYLGTPCRLVYAAPQLKKRHLCEIPNSDKWHKMTKQEDKVRNTRKVESFISRYIQIKSTPVYCTSFVFNTLVV